jgi:molybdopterin converting factor small subunit
MFQLKIEMFGVPPEVAPSRNVEVALDDGAAIPELVAALRKAAPALEGRVIQSGKDRLADGYSLNINGRFYTGEKRVRLKAGDSVALVMLASGG